MKLTVHHARGIVISCQSIYYKIKLIFLVYSPIEECSRGTVNKRPKGPHIVHLSTMCHLFEKLAKADIYDYWSAGKTQTLKSTMRSSFLSSFIKFRSGVSEEKLKMSQPIRGKGGHLVFPIGPKNTNLVEDVEILLPIKFRWIPLNGFRGEVENVSANQRPGRPSCFFRSARKTQTW